ncbi:hypothetical protein Aperf_G00000107367 [Anoplocephala perfoliata]
MPRSILRTFGFEYNDNQADVSNTLSCLTRAAHGIPGILKRAYPSSFFLRNPTSSNTQTPEDRLRSHDRPRQSTQNRILSSISASQENTPPLLKRPCTRVESTITTAIFKEHPESNHQPQTNESRVLRSRISTQPHCESKGEEASRPVSPEKSLFKPVRLPKSERHLSRYVAFSRPHYYQPHFDSSLPLVSGAGVQKLIEIPSWHVNDIIAERYAEEAGSMRVLRSRDSQQSRAFLKRRRPSQGAGSDEEFEDTSDEAYHSRHVRLEAEEIRQEKLSIKRIAEEEFRLRLEQRERESWRKRQPSRVDSFSDIDPDRFMPSWLIDPIDKVQTIHVREEIPLIAFGVRVPKPNFMSSLP